MPPDLRRNMKKIQLIRFCSRFSFFVALRCSAADTSCQNICGCALGARDSIWSRWQLINSFSACSCYMCGTVNMLTTRQNAVKVTSCHTKMGWPFFLGGVFRCHIYYILGMMIMCYFPLTQQLYLLTCLLSSQQQNPVYGEKKINKYDFY